MRYALWKAPTAGLPETQCPVPFLAVQVVPGFGQWVLVHLKGDPKELPTGFIGQDRIEEIFDAAVA